MKKRIYISLLMALMIFSCRKEQINGSNKVASGKEAALTVEEVKEWLATERADQKSTHSISHKWSSSSVNWNSFQSMPSETTDYLLGAIPGQPQFNSIRIGYRKLAYFKGVNGTITARVIEIVPEALYFQRKQYVETRDFTGRIFVYDVAYHLIGGRLYHQGMAIGLIKPGDSSGTKLRMQYAAPVVSQSCVWYDHNYINAEGEVVVYSEKECTYSVSDDPFGSTEPAAHLGSGNYAGSGGSGAASGAPAASNLPGESSPSLNPKRYMECFSNVPDQGAKMKVTVYVQLPFPGTSFNIGPNSVGHTAIGLTKTNGKQSVTQVVGFYPDASGLDRMHARSKLVDNSNLDYNVSETFEISATNFNKIVEYIKNPPSTYDLTEFNCTSFVFTACTNGGISLPNPFSMVGPGGPITRKVAMTPSGLGNSIKDLKGNENVNRNGGTMPSSKGPC